MEDEGFSEGGHFLGRFRSATLHPELDQSHHAPHQKGQIEFPLFGIGEGIKSVPLSGHFFLSHCKL